MQQVGMWKSSGDSKAEGSYDAKSRRFKAKVIEVHSGDSVTVMPVGAEVSKKLFFASVCKSKQKAWKPLVKSQSLLKVS